LHDSTVEPKSSTSSSPYVTWQRYGRLDKVSSEITAWRYVFVLTNGLLGPDDRQNPDTRLGIGHQRFNKGHYRFKQENLLEGSFFLGGILLERGLQYLEMFPIALFIRS
jgi:hypothetical protein